jgi:predicted MFS family arabinose efflux permease
MGGGIVIMGVGGGIVAASLFMPALLPAGLPAAWLGLAILVLGLWTFAHPRWPQTPVAIADSAAPHPQAMALILAYGLAGAGMVPHMVYFVDLAVRGRGLDSRFGALTWLVFGLGAILGTLTGGRGADRWGGPRALKIWLALQAAALALALPSSVAGLFASALLGGFGGIGLTAVALARTRELAGPAAGVVWVRATALFALAQAATGFVLVPLFAHTGSYALLFATGLAVSIAALLASTSDR